MCVCACVYVHVSARARELPTGAGGRNGTMLCVNQLHKGIGGGSGDTSHRKQPNIQIKVHRLLRCPRVSPLLCVLEREREGGRKEVRGGRGREREREGEGN